MTCGSVALMSFEGGSASTTTGPLEVFSYAASCLQRSGRNPDSLAIAIVTPDGAPVRCDGCVTIRPTAAIEAVGRPDLVFLAGMELDVDAALGRNRAVCDWLAACRADGAAIAAVCPSQGLLATAGLLDGGSAAIHWSLVDAFRARWPRVKWSADRMVVEDDGIYTSCGASSAIDLALYLVDRFCGLEVMTECARWFLTDLPRVRQNVPPPLFAASRTLDPAMERVEAWLHAHFGEPIRFEALAARSGMSWRTFHRRFREAFGDPPKTYIQKLRLAAARRLLETDASPIELVARRVGYDDPAFFRALFKRHTGMTPSEYRDNFRFRALARPEATAAGVPPRPRAGIAERSVR